MASWQPPFTETISNEAQVNTDRSTKKKSSERGQVQVSGCLRQICQMWAAELKEWTPTKANVTGSVQDFSHCPDSPLITPIPVICPSMSPQWETWHPFTCCRGSVCNVQTCALTKTHRSYRCLFIQLCNDWTVWLQQDKQDHTTINYFIIINRCLLFTKLSLAKASHLEMYPFS